VVEVISWKYGFLEVSWIGFPAPQFKRKYKKLRPIPFGWKEGPNEFTQFYHFL
jgi:hypothetical protein